MSEVRRGAGEWGGGLARVAGDKTVTETWRVVSVGLREEGPEQLHLFRDPGPSTAATPGTQTEEGHADLGLLFLIGEEG